MLKEAANVFEMGLEEWTKEDEYERRGTLGNLGSVRSQLGDLEAALEVFRKLNDLYDRSKSQLNGH